MAKLRGKVGPLRADVIVVILTACVYAGLPAAGAAVWTYPAAAVLLIALTIVLSSIAKQPQGPPEPPPGSLDQDVDDVETDENVDLQHVDGVPPGVNVRQRIRGSKFGKGTKAQTMRAPDQRSDSQR
jgi:hypothetical protein